MWVIGFLFKKHRSCKNNWHNWDYSKWIFPPPHDAKRCLTQEVSKTCKSCGKKVQMTGWNYPLVGDGDYSPRFTVTNPFIKN